MEQRFLCIDFGLTRIGIALSYGTLAEPLEVIINNDKADARIQTIVKQYGVTDIVVGVSEMEMAELSQKFGEHIAKLTGCELHLQDEALSSVEVQKLLREKSAGKKQYRGDIDHFAAAKILERYLDDNPPSF